MDLLRAVYFITQLSLSPDVRASSEAAGHTQGGASDVVHLLYFFGVSF